MEYKGSPFDLLWNRRAMLEELPAGARRLVKAEYGISALFVVAAGFFGAAGSPQAAVALAAASYIHRWTCVNNCENIINDMRFQRARMEAATSVVPAPVPR